MNKKYDLDNDKACGFKILKARDLDKIGTQGFIDTLKERVEGSRVYISVDIDVLDPAYAPATGTAEVGGWTTRELLTILDGLMGIEVVGADVGECSTDPKVMQSGTDVKMQWKLHQSTTTLARPRSSQRQR